MEGSGSTSNGHMYSSAISPETKIFPILPVPWDGSDVQLRWSWKADQDPEILKARSQSADLAPGGHRESQRVLELGFRSPESPIS